MNRDIKRFFDSLEHEKELVQLGADDALKSRYLTRIKIDNKVIGVAGIRIIYGFIPDLFMVVHRDYQGRGYGKRLLQRLLYHAEHHYGLLCLSTFNKPEYEHAVALYSVYFRVLTFRGDHIYRYKAWTWGGELKARIYKWLLPVLPFISVLLSGEIIRILKRKTLGSNNAL